MLAAQVVAAMPSYALLSDLDAVDARLIGAIAAITGETDIVSLDTWSGVDKTTWDLPEQSDAREARIFLEHLRRKGRFGLDLQIFGHGLPDLSSAEFARRLAHALARPLLISDCSLFGFSWFKVDPDGAVAEVVSVIGDDDCFDLLSDLPPDHPEFVAAKPIWAAADVLPQKPQGAPEPALEQRRTCEQAHGDARLCGVLWLDRCPKIL
jgi:hypothetical protein